MNIFLKLIAASCLIICLYVLDYIYKTFVRYRRLTLLTKDIPERKCIPIIGQLLRFLNFRRVLENTHGDFLKFYTPTKAFLGRELFIQVSDPVYLQTVLTSPASIEKPKQYRTHNDYLRDGLITASFERWKKTRKLLNPAFHQKLLECTMQTFAEQSLLLVKNLEPEIEKESFDVCKYVSEIMPNIIFQSMTGRKITYRHSGESMYKILQKYTIALLNRGLNPLLHIKFIYKFSVTKKNHDTSAQKIDDCIKQVVHEKREELKRISEKINNVSKMTFLEKFLDVTKDSNLYTEEQLRGELMTMLIAATDSTIMNICFILVMLGKHKDIQSKVVNEIINILGSTQVPITYDKLQQMSYLDRVIKEVMRLYPPVPFIGRRVTADLNIGKYTLPRNSVCIIGIYSLHRNARYWPNPEQFDPDRFLPEEVAKRHPYAYLPFAGGPRNCIGKGFGSLVTKTAIATILKNYEISCDLKLEDIKLEIEVVAKIIGGFKIRINRRIIR